MDFSTRKKQQVEISNTEYIKLMSKVSTGRLQRFIIAKFEIDRTTLKKLQCSV